MAERPETDEKAEVLKRHRSLHPEPERVTDERFRTEEFFDPRDLVQVKYEMLRRAREEEVTVTEAAEMFGFSRPTFYEARDRLEEEGLAGLIPKRPGPKGAHKLSDGVMQFVAQLRAEAPHVLAEAPLASLPLGLAVLYRRGVAALLMAEREGRTGASSSRPGPKHRRRTPTRD
jgi:predicted DNA-binding transcriptional regulator YafY